MQLQRLLLVAVLREVLLGQALGLPDARHAIVS